MAKGLIVLCILVATYFVFSSWVSASSTFRVVHVAGKGVGDGVLAINALVGGQVLFSSNGDAYVADSVNHRIRKISNGIITTIAGNGNNGYSGDGGLATNAQLNQPNGIALSSNGDIYIADTYNNRIRKIFSNNGTITTIAGNGVQGYSGDDDLATNAKLNNPFAIAISSNSDVYIADTYNNRIRKISNGIITTIAGIGGQGFTGDGVLATNTKLNQPNGIALSSNGDIYIADTYNNRIRKIFFNNGTITTIAGNGNSGYGGDGELATDAPLSQPNGIALSSNGDIYIADTYNDRIRKIFSNNGTITTIAGNGNNGYSGDGELATNANLDKPRRVSVHSSGEIYISERSRIRYFGTNNVISLFAGTYFNGDGLLATKSSLKNPTGLTMSSNGDIYIADSYSNRIRKIFSSNGTITTIVGTGKEGYSGDGGLATNAQLNFPNGIALSSNGDIYISDTGNNRIRKVFSNNGTITTIAGNGIYGYSGDGGLATNARLSPKIIALSSNGDIYIADTYNDRVRKIFSNNGTITTIAGNGNNGYTGDGGLAINAQLNRPNGIALSSNGDIYIADTENNRIRKIYSNNGTVTTIAGNGNSGYSGDGGLAINAQLNRPNGIALSSNGDIYMTDASNQRIRKISNGIITTIIGTGKAGYNTNENPLSVDLYEPRGILVTPQDKVYFSESLNDIVRALENFASCFEKLADSETVCNNRNGTCVGVDTCLCLEGYTGKECEIPICYGKLSNDTSNVCSSHGQCISNNTCECNYGWSGSDCSKLTCFGKLADSETVCNNRNGTCVGVDTCLCLEGYTGKECEIPICYGKLSNDTSNVCSSHGQCISNNTCKCNYGWSGSDCSKLTCFGKLADSETVCNNRNGTCSGVDTCLCLEGYSGKECEIPVCYGKLSNDTSNVCSSHGQCISNNTCKCNYGWSGNECAGTTCQNVSNSDKNVCSGRGSCVSLDTCDCIDGWGGFGCELFKCFGFLENDISVCGRNGICEKLDTCKCNNGWTGFNCTIPICYGFESTNPLACSSHGSCISNSNCICSESWFGNECSITNCYGELSNSTSACSFNGKCKAPNVCECNEGWGGVNCSQPFCFNLPSNDSLVCSSHGQCISNNTCKCNYGWSGNDCSKLTCFGKLADSETVCNNRNGTCVGVDTCLCLEGYTGKECEIPICYGKLSNDTSNVCSSHGQCISNNTCKCNYGWYGSDCSKLTCFGKLADSETVCNNRNGTCVGVDTCLCLEGYSGKECEIPICYGKLSNDTSNVCSSHGQCISNNTCKCNYGWYGSDCSLISCFGHILSDNSSMKNICSGNGNCENVDFCKCNYGWKGFDCSIHKCFGYEFNNSMTCSGNGICSSVDNCICSAPEWTGNNCSIHSCNLIPATDPKSCYGHGYCSSMNQCKCESDYSGEWCEMFNCYGKWINTSSITCKLCVPSMNCSNHGDCNVDGSCECHSNSSFGFWKNSTCSVCQENYYGQNCLTRFQDPITILDDFSGIKFQIFGKKQDYQQIDCSKIIPKSEMYLYGKNPICNWNTSTFMFSIIFGDDYKLEISQIIHLNMLVFDSTPSSETQLISTIVLFPLNPLKPQAIIAPTRQTFGSCEEITLDASQSTSFDKKQFTYIWTIPKTNIFNFETNSSLFILPSNAPSGDYTISLKVKSLYSGLESETTSISFTKNTISLPVVSISGSSNGYVSSVVSQVPLVIGTLVTLPDCISNYSSSLQYKWEKISGPTLNMISDTKDLIITQFSQKTIESYSFKVTVTVDNLGLTASSFVYLNTTLEPFTMILFTSELTTEKAIIESELSTNIDLSQEIVKWTCASAFSNDPCDSNIINILNQYSNSKTITLLTLPSTDNPILIYLQVRDVISSISITFPKSVNNVAPLINLLSVSPSDKTILASKDVLNLQLSISINGIEDGIESKLNRSWTLNGSPIPTSYLDQSNMPTLLSSSNFILLSISQLQPSSSNVLQLVATNLESGLSSSYSFKFTVAAPIPICTLTSSTNQAYALETKVTFSLSNCILNSNLQPKYYYQDQSGSLLLLASGSTITSLLPYQANGIVKIFMILSDKTTGELSKSSISVKSLLPIAKSTKEIKSKQKAWELQFSKLLPGDPQLNVLNAGTISQIIQALLKNMGSRKRSSTCQNGVLDSVTQLCICNNGFAKLDCSISTDEWLERNELMDSLANMFYNSFKNRNKYEKLTSTYLLSQIYSMRNVLKVYDELSNQSIDNLLECLTELCVLSIHTNGIEIPSGFDNLFMEVVNNMYRFRINVLKETYNSISISQLQNVTSEMTNVMVNSKFIGGIPLNIKYDFTKITTNRIYPRDLSEYVLEQSGSMIKLPSGMMKYIELASYSKRKPITLRMIKSDYSNIKPTQTNQEGKQIISDIVEFEVLEISLSNITERIHFEIQSYVNSSSTNSLECGIKINGEWDGTYCTLRNISDSFYDCSCTRQGMISIFNNLQQDQILNLNSSIAISTFDPKMEFLALLILIPVLLCIIIVIVGVVIKLKKKNYPENTSASTAFEMQKV